MYISYQTTTSFSDAATTYDSDTGSCHLDIASTDHEWIFRFLDLTSASNLDLLDNTTYDEPREWMI